MKLQLKFWHGLTLSIFLVASLVWAADSRITDLTALTTAAIAEAALHGNVFGGSDKVVSLVDPVVN